MKTLQQIKKEIATLQDEILCQKIGNDFYYTSPLYRKHILALQTLENEQKSALERSKSKKNAKK